MSDVFVGSLVICTDSSNPHYLEIGEIVELNASDFSVQFKDLSVVSYSCNDTSMYDFGVISTKDLYEVGLVHR